MKVTLDLSMHEDETHEQHIQRIAAMHRTVGHESSTRKDAVVLSAEEISRAQPTAEELKRTAQNAKESMQKLRKRKP
jgi:hypothetical protein